MLRRHLLLGTLACAVTIACSESLGPPSVWDDLSVTADRLLYLPGERHVDTLHINTEAYTGNWRAVLRFEDEEGAETSYATPRFRVLGTWKP